MRSNRPMPGSRSGVKRQRRSEPICCHQLAASRMIDLHYVYAPVVGIEFTIERERSLVPVVETSCWEFRGCFRYEKFSRIFDPNRTRISAAAEFMFCRFQQLSEIRYFVSDRQSEGPLSRCCGSQKEICPAYERRLRVTTTSDDYE